MKLETLRDLLVEQIQDVYDAEQQLVDALPRMADAAAAPQLRRAFTDHLRQTQEQVRRLDQAFQLLNEKAQRKTCKAMQGLVREGDEAIRQDAEPEVRDAGLIAAAQRIEHYEIAAYGTMRAYAHQLGIAKAEALFDQTLNEEGSADKLLTQIAESSINVQAAR